MEVQWRYSKVKWRCNGDAAEVQWRFRGGAVEVQDCSYSGAAVEVQ